MRFQTSSIGVVVGMKKTLFLGNGLFRIKTECEKRVGCEGRDKSWADLLAEIAFHVQDVFNNDRSMPVEYDRLIASLMRNQDSLRDYYSLEGRNDAWKKILEPPVTEHDVKRFVAGWFNERSYCAPDILDAALKLKNDFVLTSNYDLRIENRHKYIEQSGSHLPVPPVWHIHGSIRDVSSIVLGQSDYLESAAKMNEIVHSWDGVFSGFVERDWPLLFLCTDVYILGFGFGLDEIDLWHLLHLRSLWFNAHPSIEPNAIKYYSLYQSGSPSFRVSDSSRYDLFSTYGVKIIDVPVYKGDYEEAYRVAIDLIADAMGGRGDWIVPRG